jgi:NAD(P)-dependent dehydrogenase (short-subunit alcohol dehydrogenase family)
VTRYGDALIDGGGDVAQDLAGRTVIISGVGEGLGRETALVAAREGANVVLGARTEATLEAVAKEVEAAGAKAAFKRTDIANEADGQAIVDLAVSTFGGLDALINIAAMDAVFGGLGTAGDFADWKQLFDVNLYGSMQITRSALPELEKTGGSVVFVSSQTQHHPPANALQMAYAASKGAITGAMRHLMQEVGPKGVRVNEVAPGWMWGPPVEWFVNSTAEQRGVDPSVVLGELTANMPLRRMATDGEVAEALCFFASPRSGGITGQTLLINAGEVVH